MSRGNAVNAFKWIRDQSTMAHVRDDLADEIREATDRLLLAYVRGRNETLRRWHDNAEPFCCEVCYLAREALLNDLFGEYVPPERNERARR